MSKTRANVLRFLRLKDFRDTNMQNSDGQSGHVSSLEVDALHFACILPGLLRRASTKHAKTSLVKEYGFLVFQQVRTCYD